MRESQSANIFSFPAIYVILTEILWPIVMFHNLFSKTSSLELDLVPPLHVWIPSSAHCNNISGDTPACPRSIHSHRYGTLWIYRLIVKWRAVLITQVILALSHVVDGVGRKWECGVVAVA
ncbi:hypothetical protein AYI69_g10893 [Smittium culicis]|uniref:Uncharacterized protein n=1 Tax=Smittium culicis TaxID=133412 RepID=A0A1R1X2R3_9FUNG|nr:hypothetical protein AYI69_g10893 [Smittium culicis]